MPAALPALPLAIGRHRAESHRRGRANQAMARPTALGIADPLLKM
jgi:hypothetical protein